jgi:hypothetical protein
MSVDGSQNGKSGKRDYVAMLSAEIDNQYVDQKHHK